MSRIQQIKEMLQGDPQDSFLRHALALEYSKLGDDATARQLFEALLADEPGYVGSYYHLAHLLERNGNTQEAVACFEKGMEVAKAQADQHAYNELRSAWEELTM
jgi:Tfp pilus assembly protein PilF